MTGSRISKASWTFIAQVMSGAIIPVGVAVALAAIFRNPFMNVKVPDQGAVFMAMGAMLLFWPGAIAAMWNYNALAPLLIAIGMSGHGPVFGWSYGRPAPFIAHAVIRVLAVFTIWLLLPEYRFTLLAAAVAGIYLVTVLVLHVDNGQVAAKLKSTGS